MGVEVGDKGESERGEGGEGGKAGKEKKRPRENEDKRTRGGEKEGESVPSEARG